MSIVRLYIPKDLVPLEARENMLKILSEVYSRFLKDGIPLLDPEEDMKVSPFSLFVSFTDINCNFQQLYASRYKVTRIEKLSEGLRPWIACLKNTKSETPLLFSKICKFFMINLNCQPKSSQLRNRCVPPLP